MYYKYGYKYGNVEFKEIDIKNRIRVTIFIG